MTFLRGAALTTATTLGHADNSDLGPTEGSGFYRAWPDDLAAIQELGVTDVRITLDWARLQPKPGVLDDDWAEWFDHLLAAADAIGLRAWATLHDASTPRWFDNDGGFGDDANFERWWPRWVGAAADRFGDHIGGWIPFVALPSAAWQQPWADTWTALRGDAPVVRSVDPTLIDPESLPAGQQNATGLVARTGDDPERLGHLLRDAAEAADGPVIVSSLRDDAGSTSTDDRLAESTDDRLAESVASAVATIDEAITDGVDVPVVFIDPAISPPRTTAPLLDADRQLSAAGSTFIPTS